MEKIIVSNESLVIEKLAKEVAYCAKGAIETHGVFRVGLSGGSLVKYLSLGLRNIDTDWSKWELFFCDERFVPESDEDSTYGAYKSELIPNTPLKEEQFLTINTTKGITVEKCAEDYQNRILHRFKLTDGIIPEFDLLLLGMGPDGHTCSLFPGHTILDDEKHLIVPIKNSPKPPSERVTMTLPLILRSRCCIFAMAGASKADMAKRIFLDLEQLPAGIVASHHKNLKCIFDKEAGKYVI